MPNSSRFAAFVNLTFRVMGGKSGKIRQDVATKWQGRRQKRQGSVADWPCRRCPAHACQRVRLPRLPRYAVVQGAGGAGWRRYDRTNIPQSVGMVKDESVVMHWLPGMNAGAHPDLRQLGQ